MLTLRPYQHEAVAAVYQHLRANGIYARRYFYPLISDMPMYRGLPSASPDRLPVAQRAAAEVLCLPIYPALTFKDIEQVCECLVAPLKDAQMHALELAEHEADDLDAEIAVDLSPNRPEQVFHPLGKTASELSRG